MSRINNSKAALNKNVGGEKLLYWLTPDVDSFVFRCLASYQYLALVLAFLNLVIFCNRQWLLRMYVVAYETSSLIYHAKPFLLCFQPLFVFSFSLLFFSFSLLFFIWPLCFYYTSWHKSVIEYNKTMAEDFSKHYWTFLRIKIPYVKKLTTIAGRLVNNYSPKCRWLVVDIYRAAMRRGKYPTLATDTEMNSCFSIY